MTVATVEMSAAQTTAATGSMTGATFTAPPSMMTMSAFLPGVIDPVRSAIPATLAPSSVAQRSTCREVIRSDVGLLPSRSSSHDAWWRRPRSEAKMACIWVNWSAEAVVATSELSPTGMPSHSIRVQVTATSRVTQASDRSRVIARYIAGRMMNP